jgi:hypothetical protein
MTIIERVFLVTSIMSWCGFFLFSTWNYTKSICGQETGLEVGLFLVAVSSSIIFCFV